MYRDMGLAPAQKLSICPHLNVLQLPSSRRGLAKEAHIPELVPHGLSSLSHAGGYGLEKATLCSAIQCSSDLPDSPTEQ